MADDTSPELSPTIMASSVRKRKKIDPSELCQQLYDTIRNLKKEDGSMLCDVFIRAPKRRQEPSYYEVVANPIDLLRVQQKLKTDSYDDIDEMTADFELLVRNAKAFYKPDTTEYQDACLLWQAVLSTKSKLLETYVGEEEPTVVRAKKGRPRKSAATDLDDVSETSSVKAEDDFESFEELFTAVMTACDDNNRPLHLMFQLLPSKKQYPDYYDIIEHPIDLKFIATKIQTSAYTSLNDMEKDLLQMVKNACMFNEPGSQIYKDAKTLKKIFTHKKIDLEFGRCKIAKPKRRNQSLSFATSALKETVEESDDDGDRMETDGDSPLWQLFDQLYNTANASDTPNASGAPLGESLWKLPNRRFNPDYYNQVKKPISMAQIRNKLKKGEYTNITDMTADLYLMLDNAKKAFPQTHKTYRDAVKMQKILNQKLVDTAVDQDDSETEEDNISLQATIPTQSIIAPTVNTPQPQTTPVMPKKKGRPRLHPIATTTINVSGVSIPTAGTSTQTNVGSVTQTPKKTANPLRKKLLALQKYLCEYTMNGRRPMTQFMDKPSKKLYPDYYEVIQHPIDMTTIEQNIRADRYGTMDDAVGDFRLMFANCRKYNEEGSIIFEDSNILERALNEKLKEYSGLQDRRNTPKGGKKRNNFESPVQIKLRQMYDVIRDYREPKANRQLALIFMKLPSKSDYPDYYDIIKNPIDMERIANKLKNQAYEKVDDLAADFALMFENACKYNEPDSQLYKDALLLQQVCIQTKQTIKDGDATVPDVCQSVQQLLLSLFTLLYNHQDEESRCYSDSLAELPEYDEVEGTKIRPISFDLIKRRLDKCLYKRLDMFQEDVFACLDRARRLSRTDSQVFEDSIELQSFFIKKRDELCKDVLTSPALSYSAMHLSAAVEAVRQSKLLQEEQEQEQENDLSAAGHGNVTSESMMIDQQVYMPGDFVYYNVPENKIPGIIHIERLWTQPDGVKMVYGNVLMRPFETFHVTTRKFLEMEVFKSDRNDLVQLSQLSTKCVVMSAKDYFKCQPEGFADKDVYVCESRYSTRTRTFKKFFKWPYGVSAVIKLIPRDIPLVPKRVMSVFKERVEKHKGELAELQLQEAIIEKEKPNVVLMVNGGEEGNLYYEQYNTTCSGVVKTGDYVYVATENGKQSIAQINTMWETKDGKSYFRGPWLLTPLEIPGAANRFFYRQELMMSMVQETSPIVSIVGRCAVLEFNSYTSNRPTEIAESDVFVCESIYDEMKKQCRRNQQGLGLRKFNHSQMVTPDEVYHFKRPYVPLKVSYNEIVAIAEQLKGGIIGVVPPTNNINIDDMKMESSDTMGIGDDSLDGGPPSVNSDVVTTASPAAPTATPVSTKVKLNKKGKLVTGYILYSSDVRKDRSTQNPECTFGDISRMVGNEWRSLPANERQYWEDKAIKFNDEEKAKYAEEHGCNSPALAPTIITQEIQPNQVFECCWDKCDWQFEDPMDCFDHCIGEGIGHVQTHYAAIPAAETEYNCLWRNCLRLKKKNVPPFPLMHRLIKHVRDVHVNKSGKIVLPADRSKNLMPSKRAHQVNSNFNNSSIGSINVNTNNGTGVNVSNGLTSPQQQSSIPMHLISAPPSDPLFVTVPPRPQRVLHSEAYIKYIEGLQNDSRYITPWEKTLKASHESMSTVDSTKLPTQWLGKRAQDKPEDAVAALWRLRDYMMKDVFSLQKSYF